MDKIRISPADEGFYASSSEANHTYAEQAERDCLFCLEGWVFLGSIDHDGWEVFEAIRCRRCGGTGRIETAKPHPLLHGGLWAVCKLPYQ